MEKSQSTDITFLKVGQFYIDVYSICIFERTNYAYTLEESATVMNEFILGFFIVYSPLHCRNYLPNILDTDHV